MTDPEPDDWAEVECDECVRIFPTVAARDQHLIETHGIALWPNTPTTT